MAKYTDEQKKKYLAMQKGAIPESEGSLRVTPGAGTPMRKRGESESTEDYMERVRAELKMKALAEMQANPKAPAQSQTITAAPSEEDPIEAKNRIIQEKMARDEAADKQKAIALQARLNAQAEAAAAEAAKPKSAWGSLKEMVAPKVTDEQKRQFKEEMKKYPKR